ncbi:MAG: putative CDP-diacylglycerol--glycerol-3-phosphate 3-phosphatidyl-transferase 2 [candidate division CPR1 bacterium ADurb.Bin160]|uniref:CDP-diacylglycerol--glycerol-3-phosphate 3-phosphatidyltransferase n=1 Tax=candidate division CPR1 bacterium ADurb.Bin160 TaxID=1852826 RepID=A0A1V5ZHN2_9BACT|nr:MAG: putative CDP-diacylglycerol--glycerol-3-phosphate 3-phosphatidyl-transferase 2 [candidate division CPR1 bacterium ADurb.Bin160]
MKQLPNILSLIRLIISPVFFILLISENRDFNCIALPVFFIGAVTDYFDGWLARKIKAVSKFGKFFDPLADKFLTGFAFLGFVKLSIAPLWMVLIIIFRDVLTTTMRIYPSSMSKPIDTSKTSKIKTFIQMVFISIILVAFTLIKCNFSFIRQENLINFIYSDFTYYFLLLIVILTLWTLYEYSKNLKILK